MLWILSIIEIAEAGANFAVGVAPVCSANMTIEVLKQQLDLLLLAREHSIFCLLC